MKIILEGKSFKSIREAARYYGFTYKTIEMRRVRGYSLEQAFELEPPPRRSSCNNWLRKKGILEKICSSCKIQKSSSEFYTEKFSLCKECSRQMARNFKRLKKYGLTPEDWKILFKSQNNECAICKDKNPETEWHTDHCHETRQVRGILCQKCNHLLGFAKNTTEIIENAIIYLEKSYEN